MNALTVIILCFSLLGALDCFFGSRFKIGLEFERGFKLLGTLALSMIGMIVISPIIATSLEPMFDFIYNVFGLDPSILTASLFSNDMGGAPLSVEVAKNEAVGNFNALVVSSMMGATVSFTIPLAMGMVSVDNKRELSLGLLSGVATIPIGCFIAGLICRLPILTLLYDLLPLVILALLISLGLLFFPDASVAVFKVLGVIIKTVVLAGLVIGIVNFLLKDEIIKGAAPIEDGAMICLNASIVMSGMFPLLFVVSKLLGKPLERLGTRLGINTVSMAGILSSLATNFTTFSNMKDMDKKGILLNSAFAVSGAFTFAGHLAFTMAFNPDYLLPSIVGKLVAGVTALVLAWFISKKTSLPKANT